MKTAAIHEFLVFSNSMIANEAVEIAVVSMKNSNDVSSKYE